MSPPGPPSTLQTRQLARSGSLSLAGAAISAVMGFAFTFLLARAFGEAGAGVAFQAIAVFSITLSLVKFGTDSLAVWLMPRLALERPDEIRPSLTFMVAVVLGASAVGIVALNVLAPRIAGTGPHAGDLQFSIQAISWFLPLAALLLLALGTTRGLGDVAPYVLIGSVGVPTVRPAAALGVWLVGGSAVMATIAWALPFPIGLIAAYIVIRRLVTRAELHSRHPRTYWPTRTRVRSILGFAFPRTLSAGLDQSILWLDVVLVGMLAGPAAAGIYGGASRFIAAGMIVDTAIRVVVSPRFSTLLHRGNLDDVQELYRVAAMWLVLFSTPIYIVLGFHAPTALSWLGPDFVDGAVALQVLAAGIVITFAAGNIHSVLLMAGHSGWAAANKSVVLLVNVLGNLILIPRIGITGAAISWASSMLIDAALASVQVHLLVGIRLELGAVVRALAAPLVTVGGAAAAWTYFLGADSILAMALSVLSGVPLLAVWAWLDRRHLRLADLLATAKQRHGQTRSGGSP